MPDSSKLDGNTSKLAGELRVWFEEQFVRHAALVRAAIWNRLGRVRDADLVEDLAAECWARSVVGVQKPGFDKSREFGPWVCGVAANVCREHFRRSARQARHEQATEPTDLTAAVEFRRAQEVLELHQAIADCLSRLGEDERRVYRLRFEEGLSGRATAEALGVPESTFREKYMAALLKGLSRCLANKGFDDLFARASARGESAQTGGGRQSNIDELKATP